MLLPRHKGLYIGGACVVLAIAVAVISRLGGLPALPGDESVVNTYTTQGFDYLQRARATGDPTFYGKAQDAFDAALRHNSQSVDGILGKGMLALSRHQFHEGLDLGKQALALDPERAFTLGVIADAQIELGMYNDAVQTVQEMIDRRPDISSYSRGSYVRELHGQIDGAIQLMQEAVASGGPTVENVEWTRVQLGNLYYNKGDLTAAEREYQHALTNLPNYGYALAGLGHVRAAQGRYDEAIALYKQAIAHVPLPEFVIALGETEQVAGRAAAAQEQYGLVRVIEQLFKTNGVNTDMELALFEADHGDANQAVAQARAAYAERPNVKAADTLAWALSQAGQRAEAQQYMTEALKLGSKDALFLYHAGMIAYRAGNMADARVRLEQALAQNANFSVVYAPVARQTLEEARAR
jgi:tetratricopeptide (TPR) repeat protein